MRFRDYLTAGALAAIPVVMLANAGVAAGGRAAGYHEAVIEHAISSLVNGNRVHYPFFRAGRPIRELVYRACDAIE